MRLHTTTLFLLSFFSVISLEARFGTIFKEHVIYALLYKNLKRPGHWTTKFSQIDLNARFKHNITMLMIAAQDADIPADGIKLLLDYGAKTNLCDNNGKTALHYCTEMQEVPHIHIEEQIETITDKIDILLNAGAKLDIKDLNGRTPIDVATYFIIAHHLQKYRSTKKE